MKYILAMLFIAGACSGKTNTAEIKEIPKSDTIQNTTQKEIGVFQKVVYNNTFGEGKYYLDTWACTEKRQTHNHNIYMNGEGVGLGIISMSSNGMTTYVAAYYPYDSLVSGTFEHIKSVKLQLYKKAKTVYDYEIKIGIEKRRVEDSTKKAYEMRVDSVKMLNDLH